VQVVLVERAALRERLLRRRRHLRERRSRGEALLGREALDLPPELRAELVVVARDQSAAVERLVARRERVDGAPDDVGEDEVAAVDRLVVRFARDALGPGRQGEQRGVAGEVRRGARRRFGKRARAPDGQPGAAQPEGEDLVGLHDRCSTRS
jgi:hypothetical protein